MFRGYYYERTCGVNMELGKKIKAIRIAEGLNQNEFSQALDIPIDSIRSYENERRTVNEINMIKITNHHRFKKYTFWLMTNDVLPESGQISPDFSILLQCKIISGENISKRA